MISTQYNPKAAASNKPNLIDRFIGAVVRRIITLIGSQTRRCPMAVILINVFSVPKGKEDDFVKWWQDVKASITKQPGFISGKFHRSIKPDSKFNFINVAIWESEDVYWKAYEKSAAPMKSKLDNMGAEMVPALYNVAFEY
jgi:heme oxygenase (mycobilin-producing)